MINFFNYYFINIDVKYGIWKSDINTTFNHKKIKLSSLLSNSEMFDTLYLYIFYNMIVLVNLDMV